MMTGTQDTLNAMAARTVHSAMCLPLFALLWVAQRETLLDTRNVKL